MDAWDVIGGALGGVPGLIASGGLDYGDLKNFTTSPDLANDELRKRQLQEQANQAGAFANQAQGNYNNMTQQGMQSINDLRDLASGKNSVSAEQLRQGAQQNLATQRAMAASAAPGGAAMAARNAAMNMGRIGYGLTGQQAVAGLQERNQATQNLAGLVQGLRGQDVQAALGSRQNAIGGLGAQSYGAMAPSLLQQYGPAIQGAGQMMAMSDRRVKTDIEDGEAAASNSLRGLRAYVYRYKDKKYGEGKRVGIMAQDLEKAGLGHAVVETKDGKAVHGGHLATAVAAMMPGIDKRLSKLEGER